MRKISIPIAAAVLAMLAIPASLVVAQAPPAEAWEIGPIIRGKNYSVGMPLSPEPAGRGWSFEFPYPDAGNGHVHYLTFRPGPLAGASEITLRYRIDAERGARFVPQENPQMPGVISLFVQRGGDSWSGRRHEFHRWYSPAVAELRPGVHQMTVRLDDPRWISVNGQPASSNPEGFEATLAETARVGFVFGSTSARGHGVYSTAPARFTLLDFDIR